MLGAKADSIDKVVTQVGDVFAVLENDFEKTLQAEIADYDGLIKESGSVLGSVGKPLRQRFIATRIEKRVHGGKDPKTEVPATVQQIVEKVKSLSVCVEVLKRPTKVEVAV